MQDENEKIIKAYIKHKSTMGASLEIGMPRHRVTARLAKLRKMGVNIPRYGYYTALSPEDITRLNNLVKTLE